MGFNYLMRHKIYMKYDRHCAYCGQIINIKELQLDHIIPKRSGGLNTEENLNPSCRRCNKRKDAMSIEQFRSEIKAQIERLNKYNAGYRLAKDYGLIHEINPAISVKFYFETCKNT